MAIGTLGGITGWALTGGAAGMVTLPTSLPIGRPYPLSEPPSVNAPIADFREAPSRTLGRFRDLALEHRSVGGTDLIRAVEKTGLLVGLESFVSEANSLYEYLACRILEAGILAMPEGFSDLIRLFARPFTLDGLAVFAGIHGLVAFFEIPERRGSEEQTIDSFLRAVEDLRGSAGYRGIAESDLYALGPEFVRESFREALSEDTEFGVEVRRALRRSALGPMPLLMINRLAHLLQCNDYRFKVRELAEMPWNSFHLPSKTAFVPGQEIERALEVLESGSPYPGPVELEFGRRLAQKRIVIRRVSESEMSRHAREKMGEAVRVDNIRALRLSPFHAGEPDVVLLGEKADEADGLHEFPHILQKERNGADWIGGNLFAAEMEAHAVEVHFRRRRGNDRLYRQIAALSPYGFAMGLRLYVEQVYFRLTDVPGVVS